MATHLESELTTVKNSALERVLLVLELRTSTLTSGEKILEDGRKETLTPRSLDEEVCIGKKRE
jgi:hypothetical protein